MTAKRISIRKPKESEYFYEEFNQLDGDHPWMQAVPDGFVAYRVRELRTGKVSYFNYALAKEMGLLASDHPNEMNSLLESKLLSTFSIQIINEYDELINRRIPPETIKVKKYMATRYLQLQHSNKQGKTSGDGRGIWNGIVKNKNITWDVSSRGTGVTCLAPGAVQANRPLKTGGTEFGYGCGQAEIDELYGAAILAESMYLQGIPTERVLCIIDLGKGVGIGVRAAQNLIRPAHLFLYLKQERMTELKSATDYFINRQILNGRWSLKYKDSRKYEEMAEKICHSFAEFTATLDIDYIFAWLDWDGDNVLADAGIIDYGSVRQFGIRHDQYRYDDVERFSTNLNEQRLKARLIVQVFIQLADYLRTGVKKPIRHFANHSIIKKFNQLFAHHRSDRLLYRMGFNEAQRENILKNHKATFELFDREYNYFEKAKVSGNTQKVPDGINLPALFNMRNILNELPQFYLKNKKSFENSSMPEQMFFDFILSSFAKSRDAKIGQKQRNHIRQFQDLYKQLIIHANPHSNFESALRRISERAKALNSSNRITGNALIQIVDQILNEKKRGLPDLQIQNIIDRLVFEHVGYPEVRFSRPYKQKVGTPVVKQDLYIRLLQLIQDNRETI